MKKKEIIKAIEKEHEVIRVLGFALYAIVFAAWLIFDFSVYWALAGIAGVIVIRLILAVLLYKKYDK